MRASSIISILFLLCASLSYAAPPRLYIYGGPGWATQMDWYRTVSDENIRKTLKREHEVVSIVLTDRFRNKPFGSLTTEEKQVYKRLNGQVLWGDFIHGGLGCQLSPTFSIEIGYGGFSSAIKSARPFTGLHEAGSLQETAFSLDLETLKIISLQGFNLIGKKSILITHNVYGYAQCGIARWLYTQAENDAEVRELQGNIEGTMYESLPHLAVIAPTVTSALVGLGVQIKLHSRVAVDISWLYSMQMELSSFHIVKAGVKISL